MRAIWVSFALLWSVVSLTRIAAAAPNLSTPRDTIEAFLNATNQGDFTTAMQCLDLRDVPRAVRADQGILLAKELHYVLDRRGSVELAEVPDEPQPTGQGDQVVVSQIQLHSEPVDVALTRVRIDNGGFGWLISRATVAVIPALYRAYGPPPFYFAVPQVLRRYELLGAEAWQWIGVSLGVVLAFVAAHILSRLMQGFARIFTRRTKTPWDDALVSGLRRPVRLLLAIAAYSTFEPSLALPGAFAQTTDRLARIAAIVATGWLVGCCLAVGTAWAGQHLADDTANELRNRGIRTQLLLLRRVGMILIGIFGAAVVLLQFELVRSVGLSLLASAGLAGIVLGFALQKSLAGVIAGIQVSLTQPFRLGDAVVVEGEFGNVEQINLTYVVIRVWDDRRLIVPMQRILELPFQNWTKVSSELLGTVLIRCDHATPVDTLRREVQRICATCADWDQRLCEVAVVDATEWRIEVRIVVSACNASALWRLRCELRERIVAYLAAHEMGRALSRPRTDQQAEPS
jgi:small-conductance mechanosensitive channel